MSYFTESFFFCGVSGGLGPGLVDESYHRTTSNPTQYITQMTIIKITKIIITIIIITIINKYKYSISQTR